jgi:hypothetical protein
MDARVTKFSEGTDWRALYRSALLELDTSNLPQRIAEAEHALVGRAKELFHEGGDNGEETEELDDAMYALQALRSTLKWRPRAVSAGNTDEERVA